MKIFDRDQNLRVEIGDETVCLCLFMFCVVMILFIAAIGKESENYNKNATRHIQTQPVNPTNQSGQVK